MAESEAVNMAAKRSPAALKHLFLFDMRQETVALHMSKLKGRAGRQRPYNNTQNIFFTFYF